MSREKTVTVYKYSELSDEAKGRARIEYETNWGGANWDRADEYLDSLKKLAEHFGGRLKDYEIDWTGPWSVSFEMPEQEDSGLTAAEWTRHLREKLAALGSYNKRTLRGDGDCKLTGMCYDESAIDGFRIAFIRGKERSLDALMQSAADTWKESARLDYEYDFSDEGLSENFDANGYEFDEEGNRA